MLINELSFRRNEFSEIVANMSCTFIYVKREAVSVFNLLFSVTDIGFMFSIKNVSGIVYFYISDVFPMSFNTFFYETWTCPSAF